MLTATKVYAKVEGKVLYAAAEISAKSGFDVSSYFSVSNSESKEVEKSYEMPAGSCGYVYQMKVEAQLSNGDLSAWSCGLKMTDKELKLSETFTY